MLLGLLLCIFISAVYADEIEKLYPNCNSKAGYKKCLEARWTFSSKKEQKAVTHYSDSLDAYQDKKYKKAYKQLLQAKDNVRTNSKTLKTKLNKKVTSGGRSGSRAKTEVQYITNDYRTKELEHNITKNITAQPMVVVECIPLKEKELYQKQITVHNISHTNSNADKKDTMNMTKTRFTVGKEEFDIQTILAGESETIKAQEGDCKSEPIELKAYNSLFDKPTTTLIIKIP